MKTAPITRNSLKASLALLSGLAVLACTGGRGVDTGLDDVTVELDAFSGNPNPVWTLSEDAAGELADRLSASPEATGQLPPDGLGYRGFRIRNPGGDGGIPEEVYVSRGGLLRVEGRVVDARAAEEWLIGLARQSGYSEVFRP